MGSLVSSKSSYFRPEIKSPWPYFAMVCYFCYYVVHVINIGYIFIVFFIYYSICDFRFENRSISNFFHQPRQWLSYGTPHRSLDGRAVKSEWILPQWRRSHCCGCGSGLFMYLLTNWLRSDYICDILASYIRRVYAAPCLLEGQGTH